MRRRQLSNRSIRNVVMLDVGESVAKLAAEGATP
jgi:hypothetical protein